jgi:AcrR family transcriptional regulator
MARQTPPDRLEKLIAVAANAFVTHGFNRTQMDDIATDLGVSKGTVYRSVDSKDALLGAVLRYGDTPERLPAGGPLDADALETTARDLGDNLAQSMAGLRISAAVATPTTSLSNSEFAEEIYGLALDVYEMMAEHRVRIMVLDRCASELGELAGEWYESGRYAMVDLWIDYLSQRSANVEPGVDHEVLGRTIVETITVWAVKMPWDPAPHPYPTDIAHSCALMIRNLATRNPTTLATSNKETHRYDRT